MAEPIQSDGPEEIERQQLFRLAMQGKWEVVISHCKMYPDLLDKPLTRAEDTTLHVVISAGDEGWVIQLLDVLKKETKGGMQGILTKKNDGGSTPMHLAAALGMERACWEMALLCPDLATTVRNKNGETPLFTAVRHGKKEAFFALEHMLQQNVQSLEKRDLTHCRRDKDGNNILHCAIFGEYFDLAYEIIQLYPKLINYMNVKGESPLHYLANKPLCFRSGNRFDFFDTVIYYCIIIGPLRRKFKTNKDHKSDKLPDCASEDPIFPATWDCFSLIFTFIKSIFYINVPKKNKKDEENNNEEDKKLHFPEIYEVGVALFKLVMKVLLVILGIGSRRTQTLEKKKRKNTYAYQLMNELVEHSKAWECEKDGIDPHMSSSDLPSEPPTPQDHLDLVSKNLKPESSEIVASGGGTLPCKITDHEYPRSKYAGSKWNLPIVVKQKTIYGDIYVPEEEASNEPDKATPVLVAAKNGIREMVEKILNTFPVAVLDLDKDEKNILLLAVEYRQSGIYAFMDKRKIMRDSVFGRVDKDGNSALHLAAKLSPQKLPWDLGGAAFRMQWDIKWYKYVMHSMEPQFFTTWNSKGETAQQIFSEDHKELLLVAGKWMQKTSQSFSVVSTLIAGVAFACATTVPGGTNQDSGLPILSSVFSFKVFTIFALVAFCFSLASLLMFLNIITSPYRHEDFERSLPRKLLIGLTSLLTAIVAMLVAFCAGNFLAMEKELQSVAFAIYAITSFLVLIFALVQFPLYASLLEATVYTVLPKSAVIRDTF